MIRLFQRAMHNRVGPAVESRDLGRLDLVAVAPLVALIVILGLYPSFVVERTERSTVQKIERAETVAEELQARAQTEAGEVLIIK